MCSHSAASAFAVSGPGVSRTQSDPPLPPIVHQPATSPTPKSLASQPCLRLHHPRLLVHPGIQMASCLRSPWSRTLRGVPARRLQPQAQTWRHKAASGPYLQSLRQKACWRRTAACMTGPRSRSVWYAAHRMRQSRPPRPGVPHLMPASDPDPLPRAPSALRPLQRQMAERFGMPVNLDTPGLRILHFDPPVFLLPHFFTGEL